MSKLLDSMFGIIIVPRHPIIIEKGEQLVAILLKALFVVDGDFTLIIALGKLPIKSLNENLVFAQKMSLQSESVDCLNHRPEQRGKLLYQTLQFLVKRVLEKIII